jgi:hypothetical protein
MTDPSAILKNTLEVAKYLRRAGWKIGRQKVYDDVKMRKLPNGPCSVDEADKYALREKLPRLVDVDTGELSRVARQQAETDLKLSNKKLEKLEFELAKERGQYLPRDQFGQELSARMVVIKHGLDHLAQSRAAELLEVGKTAGPQAMADALRESFAEMLNDYANRETFQVIVLPDGEMQAA